MGVEKQVKTEGEKQETQSWWQKLKKNHGIMMVLCCGLPLIILLIAVYGFEVERKYLFWFVLLLCPLMHLFMMKDMHGGGSCCEKKNEENKHDEENKKNQEKNGQEKKLGSCH